MAIPLYEGLVPDVLRAQEDRTAQQNRNQNMILGGIGGVASGIDQYNHEEASKAKIDELGQKYGLGDKLSDLGPERASQMLKPYVDNDVQAQAELRQHHARLEQARALQEAMGDFGDAPTPMSPGALPAPPASALPAFDPMNPGQQGMGAPGAAPPVPVDAPPPPPQQAALPPLPGSPPQPSRDPNAQRYAALRNLKSAKNIELGTLERGVQMTNQMFGAPTDPGEVATRQAQIAHLTAETERAKADAARPRPYEPQTEEDAVRLFQRTQGAKPRNAPDPDNAPLTPEQATFLGQPDLAGKFTVGQVKEAVNAKLKPQEPKPYKPMTRGEELADAEAKAEASARGTNKGGGNPIENQLKELTAEEKKRNLANYQAPSQIDRLLNQLDPMERKEFDRLSGLATDQQGLVGKKPPKPQDVDALNSFLTEKGAKYGIKPGSSAPAAPAGPKASAAPADAAPTPDEMNLINASPAHKAAWDAFTPAQKAEALKAMRGGK